MKKVDAINAECHKGMVDTELAFISAGHRAAANSRAQQVSATNSHGISNAMPTTNGFFAGSQYNASEQQIATQV